MRASAGDLLAATPPATATTAAGGRAGQAGGDAGGQAVEPLQRVLDHEAPRDSAGQHAGVADDDGVPRQARAGRPARPRRRRRGPPAGAGAPASPRARSALAGAGDDLGRVAREHVEAVGAAARQRERRLARAQAQDDAAAARSDARAAAPARATRGARRRGRRRGRPERRRAATRRSPSAATARRRRSLRSPTARNAPSATGELELGEPVRRAAERAEGVARARLALRAAVLRGGERLRASRPVTGSRRRARLGHGELRRRPLRPAQAHRELDRVAAPRAR